jgi:hypothetical protein
VFPLSLFPRYSVFKDRLLLETCFRLVPFAGGVTYKHLLLSVKPFFSSSLFFFFLLRLRKGTAWEAPQQGPYSTDPFSEVKSDH